MMAAAVQAFRFREKTLREFAAAIFRGYGVSPTHAEWASDPLVLANLRGVDSHGLEMLATMYAIQLRNGGIDGSASGTVLSEFGDCILYDGQNALGQVVSRMCVDHAARVAAERGLAIVVARNSHHFGAAGYWSERLAQAGFIGISMTTAGPGVPPWPGKSPRIGTNPIAMAVPGGKWLLDMATSTVARGKLTNAIAYQKTSIPASWGFVDEQGRPTTDPVAAARGWSTPLGGYKGSGLAMMVEILCAGLSGGPMGNEVPGMRNGVVPLRISHTFLAIDPRRFMGLNEFEGRIGHLVAMMKSSEPIEGHDEILVAGEPEWRTEAERRRQGIPITRSLWERLSEIAAEVKVAPPQPDGGLQ